MSNGFDEFPGSAMRELGVGVERNRITDPFRRRSGMHEAGALFTVQKTVELLQLSAFTFPTDPAALALAPYPRPVKQDEGSIAVPGVELFYPLHRQAEQFIVFRHLRFFRIGKVRQER